MAPSLRTMEPFENTTSNSSHSGVLEVKFKLPNLDTLLFYLIFVILIPIFLISANYLDMFKYYFPMIVMLAATLTESGKPRYFVNLYPQTSHNMSSFFSKNILNLLAVMGILTNCLVIGMASGNLILGLYTGVIAFILTFPVANEFLPFIIRQADYLLKDITVKGTRFYGNWHKYFVGIVFILFFMALEVVSLRILHNHYLIM